MHYDTLIIGAGMSGLAAGIRLAQVGRRVAILEKHTLWGGLNSFYKLAGRRFDSGLHALTNFAPRGAKRLPLPRILRQLRLSWDDLRLAEQSSSEIAFGVEDERVRLEFSNDFELLRSEVGRAFPDQAAGFDRLVRELPDYHDLPLTEPVPGARSVLEQYLSDPLLREMILHPVIYYGSAREGDVDWDLFVALFRAIYLEGLARPEGGIKTLLDLLVGRYKAVGGELRMRSGVERILVAGGAVAGVRLEGGEELTCDELISSAGLVETMRLCGRPLPEGRAGRVTFVESISVVDRPLRQLGYARTATFFSEAASFDYGAPEGLIDARSGVICSQDNYRDSTPANEGSLRVTVLANYERWAALSGDEYAAAKERCSDEALSSVARFVPDVRPHTVFKDVFTPLTIERFTGHVNGTIYGSPHKAKDGRTDVRGLYLCGNDQGSIGIVGALLGGITLANSRALAVTEGAG